MKSNIILDENNIYFLFLIFWKSDGVKNDKIKKKKWECN